MDFLDFRQYYLGRDLFTKNKSWWVPIKKNVEECTECGSRCFNNWWNKKRLHPIIQKGLGFWETDSVFIMGYKLKDRGDIICPIYSYKRNKLLNGVLNTIKDRIGNGVGSDSGYGGGKFMVCLRQNMAKCALLGVRFSDDGDLPTDVINLIGSYCA
jgi:hypothetical protein